MQRGVIVGVIAMTVIVAASNYLVRFPLGEWLTWAAFTYPIAFLVTDLTNRALGPGAARRVVLVGFAIGVIASAIVATPRIAVASGTAFLVAQLLDVQLFDRLRRARAWWRAPLVSSTVASAVDTALFFGLAFAGTEVPWPTLAAGDFGVKLLAAGLMLVPFRLLMNATAPDSVAESR
ncbi:MAG: queuosine precursor transporter [Ectothiorhodospiraceae bacterium]|nr:queuosine precursor transporter [Ectothiorhodospiraceae bacterium]